MNSTPSAPPERAAPAVAEHDALAPGTRFGEFEILRVLGVGGFGIVYLALDHSLQRQVALKEYMPAALAARGAGPQITVRSGSFSETYAIGLRSFVNEARLLAKFDHPSLVKVYRFWEDNATAYMVMPYLQGRTLREARRDLGAPPDEPWLRALVEPLLGAIEVLHREGVYHRDIAPDNILLQSGSPPVLLDFGAARRVISDRTQTLTAILKPNYAPIEQYADMTLLRQGPWTDVYAVGAVLHFALLGVPPPPATSRALDDELVPLAQREWPGVSQRFLLGIDWALAVRPAERPQSIDALRAVLDGRAEVPAAVLQRAARSVAAPPADSAYDTTLILGGAATQPAPPGAAYQPTLPMQPTEPMQRTELLQRTELMQRTEPMRRTEPIPQPGPTQRPEPRTEPMQRSEPAHSLPAWSAPAALPAAAADDLREPAELPVDALVETGDHAKWSRHAGVLAAVISTVVVAAAVGWIFGASRPEPRAPASQAPAATPTKVQATVGAAPVTVTQAATPITPPATVVGTTPAAAQAANPVAAPSVPEPSKAAATLQAPTVAAKPMPAAQRPAAPTEKPVAAAKSAPPAHEPAAVQRIDAAQAKALQAAPTATPASAAVLASVATAPAAASTPAVTAAAAVPEEPKTAREACGKRVLIALWQCMERECEKARYREHPQCVEALGAKRARERG